MALKLKPKSAHTSWQDVARATLKLDGEIIDGDIIVRRMDTSSVDAYDAAKVASYATRLKSALDALNVTGHTVAVAVDDSDASEYVVLVDESPVGDDGDDA